jgi:hypothetical protein
MKSWLFLFHRGSILWKRQRSEFNRGLPSEMFTPPAQWNLFIPFHRGEISVALISLGRSLFHRGEAYFTGV